MLRYSNCSYSRIMFQFARRGQVRILLFYLAIRFIVNLSVLIVSANQHVVKHM